MIQRIIGKTLLLLILVALLFFFVNANIARENLVDNKAPDQPADDPMPLVDTETPEYELIELAEGVYYVEGVGELSQTTFLNCLQEKNVGLASLRHVIIGNGITGIGTRCFARCTNLRSIRLGDSITEVQKYAFIGCENLEAVYWPIALKSFSEKAFSGSKGTLNLWGPLEARDRAFDYSVQSFIMCDPKENRQCVLSINMKNMAILGDGENDEGTVVLAPLGIMFGPYCTIPAGEYTVRLLGAGFKNTDANHIWCNKDSIKIDTLSNVALTDTEVNFSIILQDECPNLEICCENTGDHEILIDTIEILSCSPFFEVPLDYWYPVTKGELDTEIEESGFAER